MLIILSIVILIMSVVVHELSHGLAADRLGDPTPRLQGRLTLNPLAHLDPVGSVVVPLITSMFGFTFGWAKPVEYNPYNIKNKRTGELLIAMAGPVSNLLLALIFGLFIRFTAGPEMSPSIEIMSYIVMINLVLAIFNLIPLPPLDGSKILFSILPNQYGATRMMLERFAPLFILIVIFFLWQIISPLVLLLFRLIVGA